MCALYTDTRPKMWGKILLEKHTVFRITFLRKVHTATRRTFVPVWMSHRCLYSTTFQNKCSCKFLLNKTSNHFHACVVGKHFIHRPTFQSPTPTKRPRNTIYLDIWVLSSQLESIYENLTEADLLSIAEFIYAVAQRIYTLMLLSTPDKLDTPDCTREYLKTIDWPFWKMSVVARFCWINC